MAAELRKKSGSTWAVTDPCIRCYGRSEIPLTTEQVAAFKRWKAGEFIQVSFPYWNAEERELLQTGTHPECWQEMFGDLEDEEDDDGADVPGVS